MSRFQIIAGAVKIRADLVQEGDVLDFEGDMYADPDRYYALANGDEFHAEPGTDSDMFTFETASVLEVVREEKNGEVAIVIETTNGTFGFPVDHMIDAAGEQPNEGPARTFHIVAARDGHTFRATVEASSETLATGKALADLNAEWSSSYATWEDMEDDSDGVTVDDRGELVDEVSRVLLRRYRALADGLSDMIEEGRLTADHIPDDHRWLVERLAEIARTDQK